MPMWLSYGSICDKFFRVGNRDKLHVFLSFFLIFWDKVVYLTILTVSLFIFYVNALKNNYFLILFIVLCVVGIFLGPPSNSQIIYYECLLLIISA